jgi:hypothetical protein
MKEKPLMIRIKGSQTMHFDQVKSITEDEWKILKELSESEMRHKYKSPLQDLVDSTDPLSWSDWDDIEIERVNAADGETPVKPADFWDPVI